MKELMHTTPEGLIGADATWAAGVMERDRAARNAAIARAEAAEAKLAEVTKERDALARRVEGTPPWTFSKRPTVEEMDALRTRWSAGPERYQADFDMVMGALAGAIDRAERATAERDAVLDEKRQIIEDILAAGARCGCDANKLSVREVLESMARSAGAHAGMNAASDPLHPIGSEGPWKPRQPDGYDPGAREAWAKPGTWTVSKDPASEPVKLTRPDADLCRTWWFGVNPEGAGRYVAEHGRHPATPEETKRFEAELQRSKVDKQQEALKAAWGSCRDVFAGAEKDENGIPEPDSATTRADGFGERFRLARRAAATRVTMGDVARELGTTVSFVSDVETGSARLAPTQLAKCAALFGCTPESISEPEKAADPHAWARTCGKCQRPTCSQCFPAPTPPKACGAAYEGVFNCLLKHGHEGGHRYSSSRNDTEDGLWGGQPVMTTPPDPFEDLQEALSDARRAEREAARDRALTHQPLSIPLKAGDSFVMEHDGPNLVRLSVSEPAPSPSRWGSGGSGAERGPSRTTSSTPSASTASRRTTPIGPMCGTPKRSSEPNTPAYATPPSWSPHQTQDGDPSRSPSGPPSPADH